MRLCVYVLEGRDLWSKGPHLGAAAEAYVMLQLGKYKSRTRAVKNSLDPVWKEEFVFRVPDDKEKLIVSVFCRDGEDGFFNGKGDLIGRLRVSVGTVHGQERYTIPPTWFSLRPKGGKPKNQDSGRILLTMSLYGRISHLSFSNSGIRKELAHPGGESQAVLKCMTSNKRPEPVSEEKQSGEKQSMQAFAGRLMQKILSKNGESSATVSKNEDSSDLSTTHSNFEYSTAPTSSSCTFEEAMEGVQSIDEEHEMPENLEGGILLDQNYVIAPKELNALLFAPNSQFRRGLADLRGTTDLQEGAWAWEQKEIPCLRRVVTYTIAATKFVKAVKAVEEQIFLKADGKEFAVLTSVSTPDIPYGNCFKVEVLYKISPGPELYTGEETSHLETSWNVNFHQSTVMKGMIESGARQALKENFEQFANFLAQKIKQMDSSELLDKKQTLSLLQSKHQSDWDLAVEYFSNFTVITTIIIVFYVLAHIVLSGPKVLQRLEFNSLDLPDSFGEIFTSGILVLQCQRVFNMMSHFVQARLQRGSDHGIKAQGDGWLLTVALTEGSNLASVDSAGFSDPYVVFTCNGKTRTSSVQVQTHNPQWNEILEFDAMEEPPAILDVEVFDYDGPFDQSGSLGHAEINFLRHTSAELADMWVPLEGKLAKASQSKIHLRIFLDNSKGIETIREYLSKKEKEVGKKLNVPSPHRNSMFQKHFGLPPDEFLINDFSCSLKRKLPLQGRLFLSARIFGFYSNLFGYKTKFFFLWEDIEDVRENGGSLSSMGSPTLVIILYKGRGIDARHGAKSEDEEGRLIFHFQSFVSFSVASRTIIALWRTRIPERKAQITDEQQDQDGKSTQIEDTGSNFGAEGANMLKVYSAELPVNINSLMEMFEGGHLEHKIMENVGCLNYTTPPWEAVGSDVYERCISYKFHRYISIFGGEVTGTQQKARRTDGNGWIIDEIMTLHDIPLSDHFHVHLRYQIAEYVSLSNACQCDVFMGIEWKKNIKFQKRINKNISEKFKHRLKETFELAEREVLLKRPLENTS